MRSKEPQLQFVEFNLSGNYYLQKKTCTQSAYMKLAVDWFVYPHQTQHKKHDNLFNNTSHNSQVSSSLSSVKKACLSQVKDKYIKLKASRNHLINFYHITHKKVWQQWQLSSSLTIEQPNGSEIEILFSNMLENYHTTILRLDPFYFQLATRKKCRCLRIRYS